MPRKYSQIQEHEKEIVELREQGQTLRQIGEKLGFTYKKMRVFLCRYNRKQRKLAVGIPPNPKGCPRKGEVRKPSIAECKYELKRLKMENELHYADAGHLCPGHQSEAGGNAENRDQREPSFTFRAFLLRIGLIGLEYKLYGTICYPKPDGLLLPGRPGGGYRPFWGYNHNWRSQYCFWWEV